RRRKLRRSCNQALSQTTSLPSLSFAPLYKISNLKLGHSLMKVPLQSASPHARSLATLIAPLANGSLRGAEVGVARGATSPTLLEHFPQLHLYMVDAWATYPTAHSYRQSGDSCARLTAEQQAQNADEAEECTHFAHDRRRILRRSSLDSAHEIQDGS